MANNPETLTAEEISDVLERGGPWITVEFTSNDKAFHQSRLMTLSEAEEVLASLAATVAETKKQYNLTQGAITNE